MQSLEGLGTSWLAIPHTDSQLAFLQPALLPQVPRPTSDGGLSKEIPIPVLGGLKAYPA